MGVKWYVCIIALITVLTVIVVVVARLTTRQVNIVTDKKTIQNLSHEYFASMTPSDLHARGKCVSTNACHTRYYEAVQRHISPWTYFRLMSWIRKADAYAVQGNMRRLAQLPWNVCILDQGVENGFPHTLGSIIFLPTTFFQQDSKRGITTLLHEKLHVYQRAFPSRCQKLYTKYWGYHPVPKNRTNIQHYDLRRSNPDIDDTMYMKDDLICLQVYNSLHPSSLTDSRVQCFNDGVDFPITKLVYEHPNEAMAYIVSELLTDENHHTPGQHGGMRERARRWMRYDA